MKLTFLLASIQSVLGIVSQKIISEVNNRHFYNNPLELSIINPFLVIFLHQQERYIILDSSVQKLKPDIF